MRIILSTILLLLYTVGYAAISNPSWTFHPNNNLLTTCRFGAAGGKAPYTYHLQTNKEKDFINDYSFTQTSDGEKNVAFGDLPNGEYILTITDMNGEKGDFEININIKYSIETADKQVYLKVPCGNNEGIKPEVEINLIDKIYIRAKGLINDKEYNITESVSDFMKERNCSEIIKYPSTPNEVNRKDDNSNIFKYIANECKNKDSVSFSYKITWKGETCTATVNISYIKEYPQMEDISIDQNNATFSAKGGQPGYSFIVNANDGSIDEKETSSGTIGNLPFGSYSVYAIDQNLCESEEKSFFISKAIYPAKFLTPNGDGINDTWTILNIEEFNTFRIRILTREGNLIVEYKNHYTPWDGTYNGKKMPSGDYWYTMDATDTDQSFAGHFTLLRENQ